MNNILEVCTYLFLYMYIIESLKIVLCHFFAMIVDRLQINEPFNFDIIKIDTKTL